MMTSAELDEFLNTSNHHCTSLKPWYHYNENMYFWLNCQRTQRPDQGKTDSQWTHTAFFCMTPRLIRPVQLCTDSLGRGKLIIKTPGWKKTLQLCATQSVCPWKYDVISVLASFYQCNMKGCNKPPPHCCSEYCINWVRLSDFTV